jgi:glutathione synthase
MALKVAFQMDPIGPINIDADSTFRLAEEAQARGHELFYYTPDMLAYDRGRVTARGWPLQVQRVKGDHFRLGDPAELDLRAMDVVWLRQDPPFDMGYITTTHILDMIHPATLVVNDPFWVRNSANPARVPRGIRRRDPETSLWQRRGRCVQAVSG